MWLLVARSVSLSQARQFDLDALWGSGTGQGQLLGQEFAQPTSGLHYPGRLGAQRFRPGQQSLSLTPSATSCSRASGCSSRSIATTAWVGLCGSTPMIIVMEVPLMNT
jgi:hypothetical protein